MGEAGLTDGWLPALDGRFGDHPDAVRVGDERLSWEQLGARAAAVAARLEPGSTVAVSATATIETIVAVVGATLAGASVVPVAPDAGPLERAHVLRDSAAIAVLGRPEWTDVALPQIDLGPGAGPGSTAAFVGQGDARPPLVMYTSGTTGPPKGVVLGRAAVAADLDALGQVWGWGPHDTLVHGLPLFHVHGLILGVLGALRLGSKLHHTVRPTPEAYAAASGTLYFAVPTVWTRVVAEPDAARALSGARLLVSGSAALPVPVFDRMVELSGHRPVERYGMTETLITLSTRADGERRPGTVGEPLPGVETRIVGDDGSEISADGASIGGLQVRGPTLFDGYLGLPEVTAANLTADGWFITGDSATIDAAGQHRIVGRSSIDIIKTGGYKVGAGEVEGALLAHRAVREAAVVGQPDDDLGQRIVAYVVADGADAAELAEFVAASLSIHKRPRVVHLVDSLPRNAMGKVLKAELAGPPS